MYDAHSQYDATVYVDSLRRLALTRAVTMLVVVVVYIRDYCVSERN